MSASRLSVSIVKGDNSNAPFELKAVGANGLQDMVLSQVLKMASRRAGVEIGEGYDGFATSGTAGNLTTKANFATADGVTAALRLLDDTLTGLDNGSIRKEEIFPGAAGAEVPLFVLDGVRQATLDARELAQTLAKGKK